MNTTKVSEYEQQALDFLAKWNMTFAATLIGGDCPKFCEDARAGRDMDKVNTFPRRTHIHGKHYRCTIQRIGHIKGVEASGRPGGVDFDFWNSYADEEQNAIVSARRNLYSAQYMDRENAALVKKYHGKKLTKVTAYGLLACITKHDPGDFEEFCGDFGYDTDSRRAESAFRAVVAEWKKVERFFTADELAELQEIQ